MLVNHQRPRAVVKMLLSEVRKPVGRKELKGRDTYITVTVERHKTGTMGRARLVARNLTVLYSMLSFLATLPCLFYYPPLYRTYSPPNIGSEHVTSLGCR